MGNQAPYHILFLGTPTPLWSHVREWLQDAGIRCTLATDPATVIELIKSHRVQTVFSGPNPRLLQAVRASGIEIPFIFLLEGREKYTLREALHLGACELLNNKISETLFINITHRMCDLGLAIVEATKPFAQEPFAIRKHFGPVVLQQAILSLRKKKAA